MADSPTQPKRIIWAFALGYLLFYIAYAGLVKAVTSGLLGAEAKTSGLALLPVVIAATIATLLAIVTALGWWQYRPRIDRTLLVSGLGTAVIIATTTIAYSFEGVSIVLTLILLRGGVLILAPIVDRVCGREVRWFCWTALGLCFLAVGVALVQVNEYRLTFAATANIALYLVGYSLRLPAMTKAAKVRDVAQTRRYFVGELLVACAGLAVTAFVVAATEGIARPGAIPHAIGIGSFYACLYVFGTLIYLDRRENTFCVPLNRCSSLLAGLVASWMLSAWLGAAPVTMAQFIAAAIVISALTLLSPAHHLAEVARDAGGVLKATSRTKAGLP